MSNNGVEETGGPPSSSSILHLRDRFCLRKHGLAVAWFVLIAVIVLAPALAHGTSFGSFDLLNQFGVLRKHGLVVHNTQAGDQSDSIIPWAALSWTQVHHGQLPLWNPYGALGMPLAFSWQSASFSVPSLIGYLVPYNFAFTVQVLMTLVIAGSGAYALGRVLGLGTLACVFTGTVFELSGPMLGWLGWPHSAVMSWAGWLFAAALLILRGRRGARYVAALALVVAAMIYAGQPEVLTLFAISLVIFIVIVLFLRTPLFRGSGPIRHPVLLLSIGAVAGGALGAPLLLPGLQIISASQHGAPGGDPGELVQGNPPLPAHNLIHILVQGFDGLPVAGNHWFGYVGGYSETAVYVGVLPVVLAVLAFAVRRRRPEVIALATMALLMVALTFLPILVDALGHLPLVSGLLWQRAVMPLVLGLSILSGVGMDVLVRNSAQQFVRRCLGGGFVLTLALLVVLWLVGRGSLSPANARIRQMSFIWPAVETFVGLVVVGGLVWVARRSRMGGPDMRIWVVTGRGAGVSLLICEGAFLLAAGGPLWTSSSVQFAPTPTTVALKHAVGSSLVGYGAPLCFFPPGLGIPVNAQVAYGVHELASYDPALPSTYFSSWKTLTGQSGGIPAISAYCPVITSVGVARLYGVGFVLEQHGVPGPIGSVLDATIGDEDLYRIPGSAPATLTPMSMIESSSAITMRDTPVAVTHPDPAAWSMVTKTSDPEMLRLRLTDVPGWHATIDGHSAPLSRFAGVMLQTEVPSGRHTVELNYWPTAFTQGIWLAAIALFGLVGSLVFERVRGRHNRRPVTFSRPEIAGSNVRDSSASP